MNASALLTSQGWLGPGHALDSRLTDYGAPKYKQKGHRGLAYDPNSTSNSSQSGITTGNGLVKPLLISQRGGSRHGIGKKAYEPASGNEWWLKGFQSALANIGKSESERETSATNSGTSTPRNGTNGYVGKHSGLYGYFVAGQMMKGTLEEWNETQKKGTKKRKSDVLKEDETAEKHDPLAVSPVKRPQTAAEFEHSILYLTERDKERKKGQKRAQKKGQSTDVEHFTAIGEFFGATEDQVWKTKSKSKESDGVSEVDSDVRDETKEERRARRRRRKEKEKAKLTLAQMVEEELVRLSSMNNSDDEKEDSTAEKAARKAERKKRQRKQKESEISSGGV